MRVSQEQKLYGVNRKLGNPYAASQQQTTRIVYDIEPADNTTTSLEFFVNFANKTKDDTNLTEGKLSSSESMVIKEIDIICPANALVGTAVLSVVIGSQEVVRNVPLQFLAVNALNYGGPLSSNDAQTFNIRMITDLVIPPQVNFKAVVKMEAGALPAASNMGVAFKGFGVLFNPQASL